LKSSRLKPGISLVTDDELRIKSPLWNRGYRHGNTATKSEVLRDMPFEYYEGVAAGARDWGPDSEPDFFH
jgi:hypothetical protein